MLPIREHPELTADQKLEVHATLSRQFVKAHAGQALDLYWSRNMSGNQLAAWMDDSLVPKLLEMYALKTSALLEGLAEVAALVAGRTDETKRACGDFARALGVAFQIADDVHNFSSSPKWRKVCGEDLAQGKLTYVIVRALDSLPQPEGQRLREILCAAKLRGEKTTLEEGIELVRRSGALESSREDARNMLRTHWCGLSPHLRPSEAKLFLRALSEHLVELNLES
jgi:geranylgeranyl pyrophosphate synthase